MVMPYKDQLKQLGMLILGKRRREDASNLQMFEGFLCGRGCSTWVQRAESEALDLSLKRQIRPDVGGAGNVHGGMDPFRNNYYYY